jgi:hypothetical protein
LVAPAIDAREASVATTPAKATLQRSIVFLQRGDKRRRELIPLLGDFQDN